MQLYETHACAFVRVDDLKRASLSSGKPVACPDEVMKTTKSKRHDIQTFRALAISVVLAFHLRPDLFPLGYLGVDIFFVLSGYLMSTMLSRVEKLSVQAILDFYWRRISRIIPMYAVVICAVVIIARFILSPIDYAILVRDTRWSLIFGANIQQYVDGNDYWAQVNDSPILLHMWSLGAEVQYYLLVPLIAIFQRCFNRKGHQLVFLGVLTMGSFLSFINSDEKAAFLLMFNRIWQFSIGSIAFEIDREDEKELDEMSLMKEESEEKVSSSRITLIIFIVITLICFSPFQIPIRLPVSMFTGLLLFHGSQKEIGLMSNKLLVKLGNASYVLYLVHWPVITLYKYSLDVKTLDHIGVLICLANSLIISLVLHEYIELTLLSASKQTTIIVVAVLYAAIILVTTIEMKTTIIYPPGTINNYTDVSEGKTENIVRVDCKFDREGAKWAKPYTEETYNRCVAYGNGTARILILGNSFAGIAKNFLAPMLYPIAKEIRLFAHHGCRILIDGSCPSFSAAWPRVVEAMKPDVTWIISREPQLATNPLEEPIENDTTYRFANDRINFISKYSKHVVLDYQTIGIMLYPSIYPPKIISRRTSKGNFTFEDLKVTEEEWREFDRNETLRMDTINNPKLIRHKISERQCSEGNCYFLNRSNLQAYYGDNYAHLTNEGVKLLRPSYSDVIEELKRKMNLTVHE